MFRTTFRRGFSTSIPKPFLGRWRGTKLLRNNAPEPVKYHMRLVQPRLHRTKTLSRRLFRAIPIFLLAYYLLPLSIDIEVVDGEEEHERHGSPGMPGTPGQGGSGVTDGNIDQMDDMIGDEPEPGFLFLPLSWPTLSERTYYSANDPEWQEFVKLNRDPARMKRCMAAIVSSVRQYVADVPQLQMAVGAVNMEKGKYWLDVVYPSGPPRHYEQLGIEIGSGFVALSTQMISQQEYNLMQRLLSPTALISSLWESTQQVFGISSEAMRSLLTDDEDQKPPGGFSPPPGLFPPLPQISPKPQAESTKPATISLPPFSVNGSGRPQEPSEAGPETNQDKLLKNVVTTFMRPDAKKYPMEPPRGCVVYSGMVEVIGQRGNATMDVIVAFDVFADEFVASNIKIRRLAPHKQAPRRR